MLGFGNKNSYISFSNERTLESQADFHFIVDYLKHDSLYFGILSIDLTYLNQTIGHTEADNLIGVVKNTITSLIRGGELYSYFNVSGKYYIFSKVPLTALSSKFIKDEEEFLHSKNISLSKKILFFVTSEEPNLSSHEQKNFTLGPFPNLNKEILNLVFSKYRFLDLQRKYNIKIQDIKARKGSSDKDFSRIFNEEDKLLKQETSSKVFFDLDTLKSLDDKNFDKTLATLKQTYSSFFILQILNSLQELKGKSLPEGIDSTIFYGKKELHEAAIKSLIYFQFQKALFSLFKIEKIYGIAERASERKPYSETPILLFDEEDTIDQKRLKLSQWFDATINPLLHTFTLEQRQKAQLIKSYLTQRALSRNVQIELTQLIQDLFDTLSIRGFFTQSIEGLKYQGYPKEFMEWQYQYLYHEEGKKNLDKMWINNMFTKDVFKSQTFYAALNKIEYAPQLFNHLHPKFVQQPYRLHGIFIELDCFNAFNFHYFADEKDSIYTSIVYYFYEKVLDIISHPKGHQDIVEMFSSMIVTILGDEFYFFFLTLGEISQSQKESLEDFMLSIKEHILKLTQGMKFPKTEKIQVTTNRLGDIVYRKDIEKNLSIELAHVGVSGSLVVNGSYDPVNNFNYLADFNVFVEILSRGIDYIKLQKKEQHNSPSLREFSITGKPLSMIERKRKWFGKF